MAERTLHTILDGFQKPELEDLGNILGNDLSPHLRKSQLVEQLHAYLRQEPREWMSHLMERDVRLLRELVKAGPEKVQYQDFADYPSLLEVTGLVEYDDSDEHFHKVWISREMYDIVSKDVDKVIHSGEHNGQFAIERVGLGFLNLYGIVPTDRFMDLMIDWYEHYSGYGTAYNRLTKMLHRSPLVKIYRYNDEWGDYLCSPCVDNVEELFTVRAHMEKLGLEKGLAPMSALDAHMAGAGAPYFTVGTKTKEGMMLEAMYRRLGYDGFDLVKALHDTWMEAQYQWDRNDALFNALLASDKGAIMNDASWKSCCEIVCDYADSIPKWCLCGRSARETGLCLAQREQLPDVNPSPQEHVSEAPEGEDYPHWQMPEPTISAGYASEMNSDGYPLGFAIPHVAPNDPCPCGSGLRYCRCHGKYLS